MEEVFIISAVRTPIGSFGGVLSGQYDVSMLYAMLAGAVWRPIISNAKLGIKVLQALLAELTREGET